MGRYQWEIYPSSNSMFKRTEYYFRLRANNGQIIAVSGEGYTRAESARRAIRAIKLKAAKTGVVMVEK